MFRLLPIIGVLFLASSLSRGQDLQFFARPYEAFEGDSVVFTFLENESSILYDDILSWKWDFDGDGTWDEEKTVNGSTILPTDINTSWISTFNESQASNGVQTVTPILRVTTGAQTFTQTGITEDVFGLDATIDPDVSIKDRSVADASIRVNFSANPRLAEPGVAIKYFSDVDFVEGVTGQISAYYWDLNGNGVFGEDLVPGGDIEERQANPSYTFPDPGQPTRYDVALRVQYDAGNGTETSPTETKRGFIQIQSVPDSLALGRAYRRGFPEVYGWEDIIGAYTARGVNNNRYVYLGHFEDAFFDQQNALVGDENNAVKRREMAEVVNEILQGQVMIANQRLIEALRIKYPRILNFDPDNPPDVLPSPVGAREETAAIDTALLDYHAPIQYASTAVKTYGTDIMRTRAPEGAEPFPQFPRYVEFRDPSLSQGPIPIKNEYWQLSTAMERGALGRVEKAKKLFKLSLQDETAREESKEECKIVATQSYLGMALLAAGQSEQEFAQNQGNNLLAHVKNARDLFESINSGQNPLNNDGSFIPNESFTATYQDAQDAVADARAEEINARQEERTWERYQADLRNEHLSQRNSYITPLRNLTGIDPALYNNLQTVDDQRDFRNVVNSRVESLLEDYPEADPAILGDMGEQVIALLDSGLGVEAAKNDLVNLLKRVELAKWSNAQVDGIINETVEELFAVDLMQGIAEGMLNFVAGTSNSPLAIAGGIIKGIADKKRTALQTLQTISINDVELKREVRGMLLELGNLGINIERSENQLRTQQLRLDNSLSRMDRLIEDLSHTRITAADLYFQDPSFRVVVSDAMRRADAELDFAIDRLYRLAKTLEYEWTEGYQNPITVPVSSDEPASLENPLFDKFTEVDSLFFIRNADESKDYLDGLRAWDSKLRRINNSSVRGPNHSGPISAEPISIREDILNLVPNPARGFTLNDSIEAFRNFLETNRVSNFYNPTNPGLEIVFGTTIEDNRFFPATGSRWNMRIDSIGAEVFAESGFSDRQVTEIDLIQSGTVSMRRFFAEPPSADDIFRLTFNVPDQNRTAFAVAFPAKINGATGGRPQGEFVNYGLKNRPVAATGWILKIDTQSPTNRDVDFSRIKDIVLHFTYTYGNPPEFPGF